MSEYTAIRAVSRTLQELLRDHITRSSDPQIAGVTVELRSPNNPPPGDDINWVSLWLYRVVRDPDLLNRPPRRLSPERALRHPIPVYLYYLITPIAGNDVLLEHTLMGRVIQIFNDHAILRAGALQDDLQGEAQELRLTMAAITLEEHSEVWRALQESYRLSVPYVVHTITIDSDHEPLQSSPVVIQEAEYHQILAVTGAE